MKILPVCALLLLANVAVGCSPPENQTPVVPEVKQEPFKLMGEYPALKTFGKSDIDQFPDSAFNKERVPCANHKELALGAWERAKVVLAPEGSPTLGGWGVDDVALKDGKGKLVALVYAFAPGDPGAITTMVDYFLVNKNCQILMLESRFI